jgi:hypothetical protein
MKCPGDRATSASREAWTFDGDDGARLRLPSIWGDPPQRNRDWFLRPENEGKSGASPDQGGDRIALVPEWISARGIRRSIAELMDAQIVQVFDCLATLP